MKTKIIATIIFIVSFVQNINSQELALVRDNGLCGYINKNGEWKIKPSYKKAGNFSDNLAAVFNDENEKWGFINAVGKMVIDFQFDKVKSFHSGIAVVFKNKRWFYIDKTGKEIKMPDSEKLYDFNEEGIAFIKKDKKIGLIDTKGNIILKPTYNKILKFDNGIAKINKGKLWGLINTEGKVIIEPIYKRIGSAYQNKITIAQKDKVWGIINNGKFTPVPDAVKMWEFNGQNLTYAKSKNKKIGFIDKSGKWVIEPQFKKARAFSCGLAPVMTSKKWGYIDTTGKIVIEEKFKDAEIFSEDLAPVKNSKLWGFINKKGKLVIEDKYKINTMFSVFTKNAQRGFIRGMARVGFKNQWGYLLPNGKVLNNTWYDNAEPFVKIIK
ncbi:MAG: hypothetical protein CSA38_00980 [Flavobacteriales bacterium]|nr:MAG: hypothetical protein CSA38_00980 [Flavobacteriales bacterium]